MYQDHLLKITEDSESQRSKRDEIIKNLKKRVSVMEVELQRDRSTVGGGQVHLGYYSLPDTRISFTSVHTLPVYTRHN